MPFSYSPLRYPGGKSSLFQIISECIALNKQQNSCYAEPYGGGGGLALALLYNNCVEEIWLNDLDRNIWAFWHSALNNTEALIDKILSTPTTIEEWQKQKLIYKAGYKRNNLETGFATFFLNRTNHSGIIKNAGPIGGKKQNGNYKLDCRYNKTGLANRIERVSQNKHRIRLSRQDASCFMKKCDANRFRKFFFFIDPPYFEKGASLYEKYYEKEEHAQVAEIILNLQNPWALSYDNVMSIKSIYSKQRQYNCYLNYSANRKRTQKELLLLSKDLRIPEHLIFRWISETRPDSMRLSAKSKLLFSN